MKYKPIKMSEAYAAYAKQLGKTVKKLTDDEKRRAVELVRKGKGA